MKAQQAPALPGQASLLLPRQCACTMAHWKKCQPNTINASNSNNDSRPSAGVGNQARRQRMSAAVVTTGTTRGAISVWRTKRVILSAFAFQQSAVDQVHRQ